MELKDIDKRILELRKANELTSEHLNSFSSIITLPTVTAPYAYI